MKKRLVKSAALVLAMVFTAGMITGCSMVRVKETPKAEVDGSKIIVATVGDLKITKTEFDQNLNIFKTQYEAQVPDVKWDEIPEGQTQKLIDVVKTQLLDMLVKNKVELLKAKAEGLEATADDVTKMITDAKSYYGGDEGYKKFLTEQKMTEDDFKNLVSEQILNDKLREKLGAGITVSEEDAKTYFDANKASYEEVNADHILVATEAEAKAIRERVLKGEDFNKLAEELSTDPSAKENKGNLGFFARGAMVPEFETAAFNMKAGEISQPIKTDYGFHIIKVIEKKSATFEDVKDSIIEQQADEKKTAAYDKAITDYTSTLKIEKFADTLK